MESGLEVGDDGVQLVIALGFASLVAEFVDSIVESALQHTSPEPILRTGRLYVRYRTYCILRGYRGSCSALRSRIHHCSGASI